MKRILFALRSLKMTIPTSIILLVGMYVLHLLFKTSDYLPALYELLFLVLALGIPPVAIILRLITYPKIINYPKYKMLQ